MAFLQRVPPIINHVTRTECDLAHTHVDFFGRTSFPKSRISGGPRVSDATGRIRGVGGPQVDELGMPARFGEPERFQPGLDVLGTSGRLVLSHPSAESSGGDGGCRAPR
jgi:hypothetical protein